MVKARGISSNQDFLLRMMEDMDSDGSDEKFDDYIDIRERRQRELEEEDS